MVLLEGNSSTLKMVLISEVGETSRPKMVLEGETEGRVKWLFQN